MSSHHVSYKLRRQMLSSLVYSLQSNNKTKKGDEYIGRDAHGEYVNNKVKHPIEVMVTFLLIHLYCLFALPTNGRFQVRYQRNVSVSFFVIFWQ
jgi:hypothetical protein